MIQARENITNDVMSFRHQEIVTRRDCRQNKAYA